MPLSEFLINALLGLRKSCAGSGGGGGANCGDGGCTGCSSDDAGDIDDDDNGRAGCVNDDTGDAGCIDGDTGNAGAAGCIDDDAGGGGGAKGSVIDVVLPDCMRSVVMLLLLFDKGGGGGGGNLAGACLEEWKKFSAQGVNAETFSLPLNGFILAFVNELRKIEASLKDMRLTLITCAAEFSLLDLRPFRNILIFITLFNNLPKRENELFLLFSVMLFSTALPLTPS